MSAAQEVVSAEICPLAMCAAPEACPDGQEFVVPAAGEEYKFGSIVCRPLRCRQCTVSLICPNDNLPQCALADCPLGTEQFTPDDTVTVRVLDHVVFFQVHDVCFVFFLSDVEKQVTAEGVPCRIKQCKSCRPCLSCPQPTTETKKPEEPTCIAPSCANPGACIGGKLESIKQGNGCPGCTVCVGGQDVLLELPTEQPSCIPLPCANPGPCIGGKLETTTQSNGCPGCPVCVGGQDEQIEIPTEQPKCPKLRCMNPGPCVGGRRESRKQDNGCPGCTVCVGGQDVLLELPTEQPSCIPLPCANPGPCIGGKLETTAQANGCPGCPVCIGGELEAPVTEAPVCPARKCRALLPCRFGKFLVGSDANGCPMCPRCTFRTDKVDTPIVADQPAPVDSPILVGPPLQLDAADQQPAKEAPAAQTPAFDVTNPVIVDGNAGPVQMVA